ncbi:MAG TPA: ABC transporter substrate-binding protein [Actinomycetota bacterium]|jgi:branched-chain amino acid transport system substrate-binding protein|nr:ABC transporter substrate-binding protein [Actinomycetota bacterium]
MHRRPVSWVAVIASVFLLASCAARFEEKTNVAGTTASPEAGAAAQATTGPGGEDTTRTETVGGAGAGAAKGQTVVRRGGVVKIGGLFPLSGGLSRLGVPAFQSANAYFRWLNDHGGIDGTKIQFIPCDDEANDTRSTTCAKKLIEQDGVFAMGPSFTPFSFTVTGQLERQGVPWVGYDGINVEGFSARNVVTVGAPIEPMAHALFSHWYRQVAKDRGTAPRKLGAVVLNVAPAKTYLRELKGVICPKLGCSVVREQLVNYSDTEYATICRNMQNERVDSVFIVTDPATAVKLLVQCREVNYVPPAGWLGQHGIYMNLTLDQSGPVADGTYANGAVLPDSVDVAPNREMKKIVTTYYRDADFGYFSSLGYASARLVEDLIRETFKKSPSLTRPGLLDAAAGITAYDCHGLCKDVNLRPPPSTHGGNHNIWVVRAAKGKWVKVAGPIDAWRTETWPRQGRP